MKQSPPIDGWKIMANLGYQPDQGLGENLQGILHLISEPYQVGREGLSYSGNFRSWAPLTWTLKTHFVKGSLNPSECSEESSGSESLSKSDSEGEDDLVDIWELTSAFDWLFFNDQESSEFQDPIPLMEDPILSQPNWAIDLELQISIKIDFPQSVLIFNINLEFTISSDRQGTMIGSPCGHFLPLSRGQTMASMS